MRQGGKIGYLSLPRTLYPTSLENIKLSDHIFPTYFYWINNMIVLSKKYTTVYFTKAQSFYRLISFTWYIDSRKNKIPAPPDSMYLL